MSEVDALSINVIFPIDQQLYDAVTEQLHTSGLSLDQLYASACADAFAQLPGMQSRDVPALRSFHLEELGSRENMGALMQATLVLSPDLHASIQAIARDRKKPVEAIGEEMCVAALRMRTRPSADSPPALST